MEMDFSSTDDDLRDAMAWHTPWRGVAWQPMAFITDSRSPKTNTASPRLISFTPRLSTQSGFPCGFPIASPPPPPLSGKSHKHLPPFPRWHPASSSLSLGQPFVSSRNTLSSRNRFLMGLSPRSAKLQVTSLPHFPSPRSLRLFLFVTKHPLTLIHIHPDPPRELPLPCHRVPSPVP